MVQQAVSHTLNRRGVLAFLAHLARVFVFAQAEKYRLTQFIVACPLGELDLGDEFRVYPMHLFHYRRRDSLHPLAPLSASRTDSSGGEFGGKIDKGTIIARFGLKFLVQDRQ